MSVYIWVGKMLCLGSAVVTGFAVHDHRYDTAVITGLVSIILAIAVEAERTRDVLREIAKRSDER